MTEMLSTPSLVSLLIVMFALILFSAALLWLLVRNYTATIALLKNDNTGLHHDNERLMEALTPALRRYDKPADGHTAADMVKAKHAMSRGERDAKCACGWRTHSDDPATLQAEIAAHFKETNPAVRGARNGWPQIKARAEAHAADMAQQETVTS